jgi:hypothetical protein
MIFVKDEDKLIKTVIIARSGIYKYRAEELPNLGLSINDASEKKEFYLVYRPALVLSRDADKFKMLTLTNGHPNDLVNSQNFKDLAIGYTGEAVNVEWNKEQGEVVLKTKVALVDNQALENYYVGIDEVSPGYLAEFEWQKAKTQKGEEYDIIMTSITNGNHLAMTPKARGGSVACIIDSEGGKMNIIKHMSNLWRTIRKKTIGIKDEDKQFRTVCEEVANKKDIMKDEGIKGKIDELKTMTTDLPESDEKNILTRYLEDYGIIKEKDSESAKLAAGKIADLYDKLDSESQEKGVDMGKSKDTDPNLPAGEGEKEVNAPTIPEGTGSKDASPEESFIEGLEQLFMKYHETKKGGEGQDDDDDDDKTKDDDDDKAKDCKDDDEGEPEPEKKVTDKKVKDKAKDTEPPKVEEPKKTVGDSMNNITLNSSSSKEGLQDFFKNKIKGGKR